MASFGLEAGQEIGAGKLKPNFFKAFGSQTFGLSATV
jgi:hypothetical protein